MQSTAKRGTGNSVLHPNSPLQVVLHLQEYFGALLAGNFFVIEDRLATRVLHADERDELMYR
jgi:hypothetical protein